MTESKMPPLVEERTFFAGKPQQIHVRRYANYIERKLGDGEWGGYYRSNNIHVGQMWDGLMTILEHLERGGK